MKLLIAEDDKSVCDMLRLFFTREGYDSTFVHDGQAARNRLHDETWDLVILDWMLPLADGITLCKEIRAALPTPVILLTARDAEQDRVLGLELGADDYVSKPFSPLELLARMKAVVRRYKASPVHDSGHGLGSANSHGQGLGDAAPAADGIPDKDTLTHGSIRIRLTTREVTIDSRTLYHLTPKEFDLLCLFVRYPKKVFTRDQLLESVWGYDYFGEERTVDVHIKRLRGKVSTPDRPLIATVWGVGYKLEE